MKKLNILAVFAALLCSGFSFGQLSTDFGAVGANAAPGPNNVGIGNNNPLFKLDLVAPGVPGVSLTADDFQFGAGNLVVMSLQSGAMGMGNTVNMNSDQSFGLGQGNNITNNSVASFAAGFDNLLDQSHGGIVLGGHNRVLSSGESAAIGEDNEVNNGHGSISLGGHNVNDGAYTMTIGQGLNNNIPQSLMAGFNGVPTLFVGGAGGANRVGIGGTTAPAEALHVIGKIRSSVLAGGGNVCADANGNLYLSGACGAGDNLGDHTATMDLQMSCFNIQAVADINFCNGPVIDQTTVPGELIFQGGPVGIGVAPAWVGGPMLAVGGPIWAAGVWYPSDERFKTNVNIYENALDKIKQLNGYSYDYLTEEYPQYGFEEGQSNGFLAQELLEVAPELVKVGEDGFYSVNYVGLIPVLTEAIKEQQSQIEDKDAQLDEMQSQLDALENKLDALQNEVSQMQDNNTDPSNDGGSTDQSREAELGDNTPNPFSGQTTISYHVPATASSAYISINDLNGQFIQRFDLSNFGTDASILIESSNLLNEGIYLYTLVVDNKIIDSKRMIVTK